jgi:type II secretory pathway pseudopilin PulG
MIVVALLGVLASVAVPGFISYQARSRRSEAYANLKAVAESQLAFYAVKGYYHGTGVPYPDFVPYGGLGSHRMGWDNASETAYGELGWAPEGEVYYSYETNTPDVDPAGCTCTLCFTATAFGDVDANGLVSAVMYVHPEPDGSGGFFDCTSNLGDFGAPTRLGSGTTVYDEVAVYRLIDEY